ncbi:MAG TPA: glycosyl hydrolase 53 family protein [Candidatus Limiplasma sp.]|nr:glycosyl hydrolase 53 family protein [Candidatus Limiplasma sp.]
MQKLHRRFLMLFVWIALLLSACLHAAADGVFITPVESLPDDFLFTADVSSVLSLEHSGVTFYDQSGQETDLFALLKSGGFKAVRVRVWVDPFDAQGNAYGGGVCDTAVAAEIGRRAAQAGLRLVVDFHYSDFWADPKKQMSPKAWQGMTVEEKADALYLYTSQTLQTLLDAGADIAMVQVGNETDNAMAGVTNWNDMATLFKAGSRAVRDTVPNALIAMHFSKPDARYARLLWARSVDYDVYAVSYYPFWHGTLENLTSVLQSVAQEYGKMTFVAETSYVYTEENGDFQPNSVPATGVVMDYAATVQGQANALRAVTQAAVDGGAFGWSYWEPAWLPVPGDTYEAQAALWEQFGSGWASSYAGSYDPGDAGLYYGGSSWDNQALFDFQGHPLPTLSMPLYCYTGSTAERRVDSYQNATALGFAGEPVTMPQTVDAVFNDGTTDSVTVSWDAAQVAQAEAAGVGVYTIDGVAGGTAVQCVLTITADNYLRNPRFEDEDMSMWRIENINGVTDQVYRTESINDIKSGKGLFHFYDPEAAEFRIEQTVTGLQDGSYNFSLYIMGGDAKEQHMYIYAIVGGEVFATAEMSITKWQEWQHPTIENIPVTGGTITVGAYVQASGSGPWGKLDDWMLNKAK